MPDEYVVRIEILLLRNDSSAELICVAEFFEDLGVKNEET
jgi:hypothetical protein